MAESGTPYENLTREELIALVCERDFSVAQLKHELDTFKRLVFCSKRERFEPVPGEGQLSLSLGLPDDAGQQPGQPTPVQTVTYSRASVGRGPVKRVHGGRMKLPSGLPREKVFIQPGHSLEGYREIGKEITEELDYTPGIFIVREFIRPKYVLEKPDEDGKSVLSIGTLPFRIIDKGIAGPGLLAQVIVDKYVDHLPLYRQLERFKRIGVTISPSTVSDWAAKCLDAMSPLYDCQRGIVLGCGYLQGDETPIKVLDRDAKKGSSHLGYYWAYRSPLENLVLFEYRKGRGREGPKEMLKGFEGYLQTDGYEVYEWFGTQKGIVLLGCMAHARRKFNEAMDNDRQAASYALSVLQQLYAIERKAKEEGLGHEERHSLRQQGSVPLLKGLYQWMEGYYPGVVPKSPIGKALQYAMKRWDKLCRYTTDGKLEIDNNLVENSVRPIALGRKNYLFAGSHASAQRAAMAYSLLATCKANGVNPFDWLKDVLERLPSHPINKVHELLPHNWKPRAAREQSPVAGHQAQDALMAVCPAHT